LRISVAELHPRPIVVSSCHRSTPLNDRFGLTLLRDTAWTSDKTAIVRKSRASIRSPRRGFGHWLQAST
jgi:hypothetical protein